MFHLYQKFYRLIVFVSLIIIGYYFSFGIPKDLNSLHKVNHASANNDL